MAAELKLFSDLACTTELSGIPYSLRIGPETGLNGTAGEIAIKTIYAKNTGDVLISNIVLTESADADARGQYSKGGVFQVETAAITVTSVTAGDVTVTVTGALVGNSPKAIEVTVAESDADTVVAGKIRTALQAQTDITTNYTVGGTGANVSLTAKATAANDTNLNIAVEGICGVVEITTSTNTTLGVADGAYNQSSITIGEMAIGAVVTIHIKVTVEALTEVHVDEPLNFSISGTHL
jgi:hypothetical protein